MSGLTSAACDAVPAAPSARLARALGRLAIALPALCAALVLASAPALAKAPPPKLPSDRDLVDEYAAVEGAHLAEALPGGPETFIKVVDSPQYSLTVHVYGRTYAAAANTECKYTSFENEATSCEITVYRAAHREANHFLRGTIAHEVFHVFEARMSHGRPEFFAHGGWLIEGAATWAESDLVEGDDGADVNWRLYLRSPATPLFSRVEEAVGFFGHMESSGINPWGRFKAMFEASSNAASYDAAGVSKTFLDNEASVFFRERAFGDDWNATGKNVPSAKEVGLKIPGVGVTGKSHPKLVVKPYADGVYTLSIAALPASTPVAEVVLLKGSMRLRSTDGEHVNALDEPQVLLCSDPKGCSCPGHHSDFQQFKTGDLALTGGVSGGEVEITPRKPCEVLLPQRSCEGLLPGFDVPLPQGIKAVVGQAPSAEVTNGSSSISICLFLAKGSETTNAAGESVFDGVIAASVSVQRYPSVPAATEGFKRIPPFPKFLISHPAIGEEADLFTSSGDNGEGIEYSASAAVRVENVVAQFTIFSTPGNIEANPASATSLLAAVASKL